MGAVQIRRLKAPNPPRGVEDKWGKETNKSSVRHPEQQDSRRRAFYINQQLINRLEVNYEP